MGGAGRGMAWTVLAVAAPWAGTAMDLLSQDRAKPSDGPHVQCGHLQFGRSMFWKGHSVDEPSAGRAMDHPRYGWYGRAMCYPGHGLAGPWAGRLMGWPERGLSGTWAGLVVAWTGRSMR